jgi:hypothetical protein
LQRKDECYNNLESSKLELDRLKKNLQKLKDSNADSKKISILENDVNNQESNLNILSEKYENFCKNFDIEMTNFLKFKENEIAIGISNFIKYQVNISNYFENLLNKN